MSAQDLAREIISLSQTPDRPSPLVLVVYSRSSSRGRPRDFRNENDTMRVTAPTIGGEVILRVSFPAPNYTPSIGGGGIGDGESQVGSRQTLRTILEYVAWHNLEGASSCVEGYMSYRDQRDVMLFTLTENGALGSFPLARWSLEERGDNDSAKIASRNSPLWVSTFQLA
eukprot:scaffold1657_cov182-Alexandrium_tamarense.AAC.23